MADMASSVHVLLNCNTISPLKILHGVVEDTKLKITASDDVTTSLQTIESILKFVNINDKNCDVTSELQTICCCIENELCVPILHQINSDLQNLVKRRELLRVTCEVLWLCLNCVGKTAVMRKIVECNSNLLVYINSKSSQEEFTDSFVHPLISLEIIKFVLQDPTSRLIDQEFICNFQNTLDSLFTHCNEQVSSMILINIIPKLLKLQDQRGKSDFLQMLWEKVKSFFKFSYCDCTSTSVCIGYLILCNIMEYFMSFKLISETDMKQIYSDEKLWRIIQLGLIHENNTYRKRTFYVMKQILASLETNHCLESVENAMFPMNNDKKNCVWSNYILIMETLEEKQIHVIKPVLTKVEDLVESSNNPQSNYSPLPIHWIVTIYHRMFMHDAKFIKKWGLLNCLALLFSKQDLLDEKINEFIFTPLMSALNDPSIFARTTQETRGSVPAVANSLTKFFLLCSNTLSNTKHQEIFFCRLLQSVRVQNWAPVPLLYLSHSMSQLPVAPVWTQEVLPELKDLITESLCTQDKFMKSTIQHFLLQAFLNLAKLDTLSFDDLSYVLILFSRETALRRGSQLWQSSVCWLKEAMQKGFSTTEDPESYSRKLAEELNHGFANENTHAILHDLVPERITRILLILLDAGTLTVNSSELNSGVAATFESLTLMLLTMTTRPYLPVCKIDRSLQFLLALFEELQFSLQETEVDAVKTSIRNWLLSCSLSVINYISQQIPYGVTKVEDVDRLEMYLRLLNVMGKIQFDGCLPVQYVSKLAENCCNYFGTCTDNNLVSQLGKYSVMKCLAWILNTTKEIDNSAVICYKSITDRILIFIEDRIKEKSFAQPLSKWDSINQGEVDKTRLRQWGRIVSDCISSVWICIRFYLLKAKHDIDHVFLMNSAMWNLEIGTDVVPAICPSLKLMLPHVINSDEVLFEKVIDRVWTVSFERRKTDAFWVAIKAVFDMLFQPALLSHAKSHLLRKYYIEAYRCSETCPNIFSLLMFHCYEIWNSSKDFESILSHHEILALGITFGPIHRKDQKVGHDAAAYIATLKNYTVNTLTESDYLDNISVRAAAISLVLMVDKENSQKLANNLIKTLCEEENRVTAGRVRYFANSLIHCLKNRIWQALLILEPLCSEDVACELLMTAYAELMKEGAQLSVRMMQEWLAVRILLRFSLLREQFWENATKASEIRAGSVGSFLAIVMHLAKLISLPNQEDFIDTAVLWILPWCMTQNFNSRVTAQVALHNLWKIAESNGLTKVLETYKAIRLSVDRESSNGNAARYTQKLLDEFYYKEFDGIKHYSLETIFHEFPRLTHVTDQEWIPVEVFSKYSVNNANFIAISNPDRTLNNYRAISTKDSCDQLEKEIEFSFGNVQKKITPWRQTLADEEPFVDLNEDYKSSKQSGLVVVASLIDRLPNLGGLCRTCEIFGAAEYVMNNVRGIEDKQFQNLSVSSEKWLPISEVKPFQLRDYLLKMKDKGYTLVGAEQTAHSIKLQDYKFPEKTLLLLGNEKEGIPVDLIQLLDVCLEIPQRGLIRSLNVHVSGAVIIWEYTRQHTV